MKLTKSRHLSVLVCIFKHDGVVTSEYLATFSGASVRTIKHDIQELNEQLIKEGILRIVSTRSKGYYAEPIDREAFEAFQLMCLCEHGFYQNFDMEKMTRRLYLLQRILSSEYCRMDELADELYITKSAVKEDMEWVTRFLYSHRIQLRSIPGKGVQIAGAEVDIRSAMVEAFCSQYHEIKSSREVVLFNQMFYDDPQYYADVRHECLRLIRNSKLAVRDITTKKFSTYICLIQNRIKHNNIVHLAPEMKQGIESTYEYALAKQILELPILEMDEPFPEDEIYWFAIQFLYFRDIDLSLQADQETISFKHKEQAKEALNQILQKMEHTAGMSLLQPDEQSEDLLSLFIPIYLCAQFDTNARMRLSTYEELGFYEFSPLAVYLAVTFLAIAQDVLRDQIGSSTAPAIISYIDYQLKKVNYEYKKRRLAVLSVKGKVIGNCIADNVMERFGKFIEYLHVFNQYEMRRIRFTDYDAVIAEVSGAYNFYPISFYQYDPLSIEDGAMKLFQDVFVHGYPLTLLDHMSAITQVFADFDCEEEKMFLKLISFKYAAGSNYDLFEKQLQERMQLYDFYCANSGIAMILCDYEWTKKEFIECYIPKSRFNWRKEGEVKAVIIASMKPEYNISELKLINKILQILWYNPKYIQAFASDIRETYQQIVNDVTKNQFLRK